MTHARRRVLALAGVAALLLSPTGAFASAAPQHDVIGAEAQRWQLGVPVLYYHHIACPPANTTEAIYYLCPTQFNAQLSYLKANGWRTITADQLAADFVSQTCPADKTFVVSLDDGDEDAYANAAPILEGQGMRGTFFVIPGKTPDQGELTTEQMRDLAQRGHAIGNHTLTHPNLKKLDHAGLVQQIEGAEVALGNILGYRPATFAYPYGRYNDAAVAQVAASGFDLAFTVRPGAVESTSAPLLSKRIETLATEGGPQLLAKLAPFADPCPPATPDLSIARAPTAPLRGVRVLSSTPLAAQTVKRAHVRKGTTYDYSVRLADQSNDAGAFTLRVTLTDPSATRLQVVVNGVDVTTQVRAGTFTTGSLAGWSTLSIDIKLTPVLKRARGTALDAILGATNNATGRVDVVRARVVF